MFVLVGALACSPSFETQSELPKVPRRPDGVVLDLAVALPEVTDRGATGPALVALREPIEVRALTDLVRRYFKAWEREDVEGIARMLSADAVSLRRSGQVNLLDGFRNRMRTYEYQKIAGLELARLDRLERFAFGDLEPGRGRPTEMREGDVLVRVPIATPRLGGDPLFGEVLVLLVRREEGELRIAGVAEESGP